MEVAFSSAGLFRGIRRGIPLGLPSAAFGLVFGVLGRHAGLSLAETCLMSAAVNAGSSQIVALGMWSNALPVMAIAATTLLVNLRLSLIGMTLAPWYVDLPKPASYGTYFFLTDESWALTVVEFERTAADGAFMLGVGLVMFVCWVGGTAVGRITGQAIHDPSAWGLDFAIVAIFVALLVPLARDRGRSAILPWSVAAATAIIAHRTVPGNWYILLGALAGALPAILRGTDA